MFVKLSLYQKSNKYHRYSCNDMSQTFNFDKFMDDLLIKEAEHREKNKQLENAAETPQREYIRRYSETPHNRMKVKP